MSRQYKYRTQISHRLHNPSWNKEEQVLPFCQDASIECNEKYALILFLLNILCPGLGTFISSGSDRKGFNCAALGLSFL